MTFANYKWEYLSILRFFLAFIVMAGHLGDFTSQGPLTFFTWMGSFQAILGFLLISGFSIGQSLKRNPSDYFKRRAQRIYPIYIASILLVFCMEQPPISVDLFSTLLINIFFLNQAVTNNSFVGPAWSLSLEVWLYILAPLLIKFTYKNLRGIICFSFLSYVLYQCGRTLFDWNYYSGVPYALNLLFLSFIWIAGLSLSKFENTRQLLKLLLIGHFSLNTAIQIVYRIKNNDLLNLFTTDLIKFIFGALILFVTFYVVVRNDKLPAVSEKTKTAFNFLGNISYPLYLIHIAIFSIASKSGIVHWIPLTAIALLSASLFYYLFDFYSQKREKKTKKNAKMQSNSVKVIKVETKQLDLDDTVGSAFQKQQN
ncbi:MAG: acyltransferase [Pedobacter sp.]|nr:MAG: acyltransferase [Pedobacter sp.]